MLEDKPVYVIRVSERGSSTVDPFTNVRIERYSPLVIRIAVRGVGRVKVFKIVLRIAEVNGRVLERDVVGAINIGLRYLNSNGSPVALGSTGACEVWVKPVNPHQGLTPLTEINTSIHRYHRVPLAGKRLVYTLMTLGILRSVIELRCTTPWGIAKNSG